MGLIYERNDALNINPPQGQRHLSVGGSDWLWAVMAIYLLCFLLFVGSSFRAHMGEKIFHYLFTVALFVGAISYFAMASDLAFSVIPTQRNRGEGLTYQVFFAKYINWVVSFPAVIMALGLLSGTSWASILFNIFLSWIWIISYLVSAYTRSSYKWGFFAFGTAAYICLAIQTLWSGRSFAGRLAIGRDYTLLAGWLNLLWLLYPIAYACTDGGNVIGVTQSLIWFGILDILMIPVLGFAFIFLARRWDYGALNLHFTQYGRVPAAGNTVHPEKAPVAASTVPATAPGTAPATMAPATAPATTTTATSAV